MLNFTVDADHCTRCGLCVMDCPARIIRQNGDHAIPVIPPDQETYCVQCQHCLAICPTAAVSILGKHPEDSEPLTADGFPSFARMAHLLRGRRSVRQYKDENVDPALLRRMLTTLAHVPTGANQHRLTFHVIDDRAVMKRLRTRVMAALHTAAEEKIVPTQGYLHRIAMLPPVIGTDILFRTAPHALFVTAPPDALCPREDIPAALAYFDLLAHSAGLGTAWWGMIQMVFDLLPELKELVGIPDGHFYYGMLFGVPAMRYARTVQRDDAIPVHYVGK